MPDIIVVSPSSAGTIADSTDSTGSARRRRATFCCLTTCINGIVTGAGTVDVDIVVVVISDVRLSVTKGNDNRFGGDVDGCRAAAGDCGRSGIVANHID